MTMVINSRCCRCMNCYDVCPVEAIVDMGDSQLYVDSSLCNDCGRCRRECPSGAITSVDDADQKWIDLNDSEAKWEGGHACKTSNEYDDPDDFSDDNEDEEFNEEELEENW